MCTEEALEETNKEILVKEMCTSVARLKSKKAPGARGITVEMIKAGVKVTIGWMHNIMNMARNCTRGLEEGPSHPRAQEGR